MARGRRTYHWKHGWIPVSPEAKAYVAGRGPRPTSGRVRNDPQLATASTLERPVEATPDRSAAILARRRLAERAMGMTVTEVDGVEFVEFDPGRDVSDFAQGREAKLTTRQKREIAATVNEIREAFPNMGPVRIVPYFDDGNYAITDWSGSKVHVSMLMFRPNIARHARERFGKHGALAGSETSSDREFRRAVMVHELGHVLQLQREGVRRQGERIAHEEVTVRDVGYTPAQASEMIDPMTRTGEMKSPDELFQELRDLALRKQERWQIDTLLNDEGPQTVYGTANVYEWFAEAFADGYLHGETGDGTTLPSASGLRVLELLHQAYGRKDDRDDPGGAV